jgi:hypothetical protein
MFRISESIDYDKALHELKRTWILLRTDFNQSPIDDRMTLMNLGIIAQGIDSGIVGLGELMEVIDYDSENEVYMLYKDFKYVAELITTFDDMYSEALLNLEEKQKEIIPEIKPETSEEEKMARKGYL